MHSVFNKVGRVLSGFAMRGSDDADHGVMRLGYLLLLFLFFGSLVWANVAPLEIAVRASGVVQVEGKRKNVQHLEGGIIASILVSDGDRVTRGELLVQFETAQSYAELRRVEGRLWATQASVDRLTAERDNFTEVKFRPELLEESDPRALMAMENERTMFSARQADRFGQMALISQRRAQYSQQLEGLELMIASKTEVADSLKQEITELESLLEEGYIDKQRIRQLSRSLSEAFGEIEDLKSRFAVGQVSIKEAELEALQLDKRFKTQVTDALTDAHDQLFDLKQLHEAIVDRVVRADVRAPVAGTILDIKPNVRGAVVGPGDILLSIVPNDQRLVVSAKIQTIDIDSIEAGQPVELRFSVFKGSYMISGTLAKVSADSLVDKATGLSYYSAKIELSEEDLFLLEGKDLVPGMPVEVLIKTGKQTFFKYLTMPVQRAFNNALIEE